MHGARDAELSNKHGVPWRTSWSRGQSGPHGALPRSLCKEGLVALAAGTH